MLASAPHRSGPFKGSKESIFEYYRNFEEYPHRYPNYCKRVEVLSRSDNTVTTREFWSISLGMDVDHVLITVRYKLIPFTEISYEIIDATLAWVIGISNSMRFSDLEGNPNSNLVIEIAMPILDITGHPNAIKSSVYEDLELYLTIQDSLCISNNQDTKPAVGQTCHLCNEGILYSLPGDITENRNHKLTAENFQCDTCHEVLKYYLSFSKETI